MIELLYLQILFKYKIQHEQLNEKEIVYFHYWILSLIKKVICENTIFDKKKKTSIDIFFDHTALNPYKTNKLSNHGFNCQ